MGETDYEKIDRENKWHEINERAHWEKEQRINKMAREIKRALIFIDDYEFAVKVNADGGPSLDEIRRVLCDCLIEAQEE